MTEKEFHCTYIVRKKTHFYETKWSRNGLIPPMEIMEYTGKKKTCGLSVFPEVDEEASK
jgi:hypothetical protein